MIPAVTELLNKFAVAFDLPLLDWIQTHLGCELLDKIMPIITMFGDDGIFWIACAAILLLIPSQRRNGLAMGIALAMGLIVCNLILKPVVQRIRPYDWQALYGVHIPLLISGLSDFSYPSGHTIASFEASVALLKGNKVLGIPALILAFAIAFSRLYLYVHYPSDVAFSMVLGTLFALFAYWLAGKIVKPPKKGKYEA